MSEVKSKQVAPFSTVNPDGTVTVKLKDPIKFGEEIIETLLFQKPKAKHLKGLDLSKMGNSDSMLTLMSRLTAQFPQALDEMSIGDLIFCSGVIETFLPDMEKGGKMA